ncbi:MAG: hypothetical protein H6618_10080 [Deltaproteobacteria bacterium]|nr:hypothetical protein [Deltaproteobacteria bacterium]MCB9229947.1 hypothetical protein [Deltaproteobacteria bacterium]
MVRRKAQRIRELLKKGAFRFGTHSEFRTQDRMLTEVDIMNVGKTASTVKSYEDGRWKVVGLWMKMGAKSK